MRKLHELAQEAHGLMQGGRALVRNFHLRTAPSLSWAESIQLYTVSIGLQRFALICTGPINFVIVVTTSPTLFALDFVLTPILLLDIFCTTVSGFCTASIRSVHFLPGTNEQPCTPEPPT